MPSPYTLAQSVLVVEDDPHLRIAMGRILRAEGFRVASVSDNNSALEVLRQEVPHLVLTDIYRAGGTGIELLESIRADQRTTHVPVIVVTGKPTVETAVRAKELGAWMYFTKPVGVEELLRCAFSAIGRSQDPALRLLDSPTELRDLDFKESLDFSDKRARAELARDFIAMANSGGGTILVGVAQAGAAFSAVGIPAASAEQFDATRLGDAVRAYTGGVVAFTSRVLHRGGAMFGAISIKATSGTIALAAKSHEGAGLFTGRIYVRTDDARTTEVVDAAQLAALLERAIEQRNKQLTDVIGHLRREDSST